MDGPLCEGVQAARGRARGVTLPFAGTGLAMPAVRHGAQPKAAGPAWPSGRGRSAARGSESGLGPFSPQPAKAPQLPDARVHRGGLAARLGGRDTASPGSREAEPERWAAPQPGTLPAPRPGTVPAPWPPPLQSQDPRVRLPVAAAGVGGGGGGEQRSKAHPPRAPSADAGDTGSSGAPTTPKAQGAKTTPRQGSSDPPTEAAAAAPPWRNRAGGRRGQRPALRRLPDGREGSDPNTAGASLGPGAQRAESARRAEDPGSIPG